MTYPNLAESERLGIISLCNDLKQQGALHSTIEHVRELLTSRVSRLNDLAALVRELAQPAPVIATELRPCGFCDSDEANHKVMACINRLREQRDTLRARVAELERVTEEQVERACVAFYGERGWKTAPARMANESRAFMRAALTAARGGG